MRIFLLLFLLTGLAGLGWANYWLFNHPWSTQSIQVSRAQIKSQGSSDKSVGDRLQSQELDNQAYNPASAQTLSRPLFFSDRRPFVAAIEVPKEVVAEEESPPIQVEEPEIVVEEPPEKPVLSFLGTNVLPSEKWALIMFTGHPAKWINSKSEVQDWQVEDIGSEQLVLTKDGHKAKYLLFKPQQTSEPLSSGQDGVSDKIGHEE